MSTSPIYRDTLTLAAVVIGALEEAREDEGEGGRFALVRNHLSLGALRLVDHISRALGGHERWEQLADADAELCSLRAQLALAHFLGLLDDEAFTDLAACAEVVGRQLGGWRRHLEREGERVVPP